MAKSERRVRGIKATLSTAAARPPQQRRELANKQLPGPDAAATARRALPTPSRVPDAMGGVGGPDATGQIGTPGNLNVFGFLTGEDYNPDLDGFPMFPNYNQMRLSDAQVNATLLMLKLPLKGATWIVKPPAHGDEQDQAIADFVQQSLIDDDALDRSWQHVLDNAMLKFDFGCAAAEIIWALGEAGEAKVQDLAPRLPRTFYRWVEDPKTGKLAYLQQFAPKRGQYGYWNIPAESLVLHVRNREGNAYYGRSVLRSAYPHWWWKQQLYRIDMIGHDRFHVGIPRASLDKDYNATKAPIDKIETTLKGLRSHDRAYMVQPFGVVYDIYGRQTGSQAGSGILDSVDHHNQMIARNILQSFTAQGEQKHGSFGAAKVTSDVYFDALEGEANEIGSELKQAVVKRLCDLNFDMRGRKYPTLVCTDISAVDFTALATALAALVNAGVITADDDLETWVRDLADAPGLPEALKGLPRTSKAAPVTAPTAPANTPLEPIEAAKRGTYTEAGRVFLRAPTALERKAFNLHGIPSRLDAERDHLVRQMADIRRSQLQTVAKRLAAKDSRTSTRAFTDMRHAQITMPQIGAMERVIRERQTAALEYGRAEVRNELERQGVTLPKTLAKTAATNKQTATSALVTSAKVTAQKQADTWQARIMDTGIRLRRIGLQGDELRTRIEADLEGDIESGAKRDAAGEVHEAFGIGRAQAARELSDLIETATYSAILDSNTCDTCEELDGEEFTIDSPEYDANMPPNANCDGRDNCRCVYLYVASTEAAE